MPNPHVHTAQSAKKPAGLPSEDHWASERGTTAASVRKDLADLKAVLGPAALADRLNTGKSSINNIILGHNTVGPTILAVLYGETGCTLKPTLAALLSSPAETQPQAISVEPAAEKPDAAAEATQPLETKADARNDDRQPGSLSQYIGAIKSVFEGVGAVFVHPGSTEAQSTAERHQMLPDLSHLNVGDLLANAERRRFALSAELAEVEDQIKAVLKLATASVQFKSDDDGFAAAFKSVAGAAA